MYTAADLKYLELISDRSRLVGTCYFELYPSDWAGTPTSRSKGFYYPTCWNDGSLYIADTGFDLIAPVFERAVASFDYNDFIRVSADELSNLEKELPAFITTLQSATLHSEFLREHQVERWSSIPLQSFVPALTDMASGIATFCRSARERVGVLWVLGM
jgi:hypothetical protein